jgi:putative ABC transport system permease protein
MILNFFVETFALGVKNLFLHKLRSLLTTLGIIFGVAAVIIMVAIGEGTKQAALEQLRQLGAKNIVLRSVVPPENNDPSARASRILEYGLRRADLRALKITFRFPDPSDVDVVFDPSAGPSPLGYVVPIRDTQQRVIVGDRRINANAIGTTAEVFDVVNLRLERGRYFTDVDCQSKSAVCVLGALAAQQMFPYEDPLGRWVTVGSADSSIVPMLVVGVLEKTGLRPGSGFISRDIDSDVYFPLSLARDAFTDMVVRRQAGSQERKLIELTEIWLQAKTVEEVEALASIAENAVAPNHTAGVDFEVKVPIEILRNAERLNRMFNFVMVGIASFSLIVGGIGIMNIMLASVTERTREIGIRRALGAKQKHIILQFLVETTVVSLMGGVIGIGLGAATATLLPIIVRYISTQDYPTQIAVWSVVTSFIVSALIGIGFGLYPAVTAARMDPIEALRHE